MATSRVAFEGFRTVYTEADEEKEESNVLVNGLSMDSVLTKEALEEKQHFTQPPAHYTEATLVKTLEELGIGRPSTYAPLCRDNKNYRETAEFLKSLGVTYVTCSGIDPGWKCSERRTSIDAAFGGGDYRGRPRDGRVLCKEWDGTELYVSGMDPGRSTP